MARLNRVPLWQKPRDFVNVEDGATKGAVIGVNVFNQDGSLFEPSTSSGGSSAPTTVYTYWRNIREVPVNVEALASLATTGIYVVTDATDGQSTTRQMDDAGSLVWSNPSGVAGNPSVQLVGDVDAPGGLFGYGTAIDGTKGWYRPALFESTGLLAWSAPYLRINLSDPTKFDIGAAVVGYTDYDANPVGPTRAYAVYGPTNANPVPNLAVIATWVGIQTPGLTLVTQNTAFTPAQRRSIVQLGAVISNGSQLIAVNNLPVVLRAGINQVGDFMRAVGPINNGNLIGPNGANLQINKGAGSIFKEGANFANNPDDPHNLPLAALTPANFNYRTSTGTQAATTNAINVTQYESPLGTLATVPNNRFTVQRVFIFSSNLVRIQYGQTVYQTMAEAEAAIATQAFATESNIAENGVLLAFLIVEKSATDLSNPAQAKFIPADKFGGVVGSGGTSITNTDSLPEGVVNLYFTDERAQDAVGGILANTADIQFTYNDAGGSISAALTTAVHVSLSKADSAVQSVVAGTGVTVNNTDPRNPIVSATGGGGLTTGLYSARPAAAPANSGALYYATDVRETYRSDGSTWAVVDGAGNELGYAEGTVTFNTVSTTLVDVPGMSITVTAGERPMVCKFGATLRNLVGAGPFTRLALVVDGSPVSQILTQDNLFYSLAREYRLSGLTPGTSHVVKLQVMTQATGTAVVFGDALDRHYLQVVNS